MGWILGLDCSAPRTCVILGRSEDRELVVADARQDRANQTSVTLHERLAAALAHAGIRATQLDAVACGRGPGTFTGARVAVATAQGLALGLDVPVIPVSTLAALAASGPADAAHVLALLDARRSQVYGGRYRLDADGAVLLEGDEQVTELAKLVAGIPDDARAGLVAIGPGCEPYAEQLPQELRARALPGPGPSPAGLWRATLAVGMDGAIDPAQLQVHYLRESYAEMGINKPKRAVYKSEFV